MNRKDLMILIVCAGFLTGLVPLEPARAGAFSRPMDVVREYWTLRADGKYEEAVRLLLRGRADQPIALTPEQKELVRGGDAMHFRQELLLEESVLYVKASSKDPAAAPRLEKYTLRLVNGHWKIDSIKRVDRIPGLPSPKWTQRERTCSAASPFSSPEATLKAYMAAVEAGDLDDMYRCRSRVYLERAHLTDKERFREFWRDERRNWVLHTQMAKVLSLLGDVRDDFAELPPDATEYELRLPREEPEGFPPVPGAAIILVKEGKEWKLDSWGD